MEEKLLFVTAQPDVPYFHWQVRVYVQNFTDLGINPKNIHVIFGMVQGNSEPTKESLELKDLGINVHHYLDDRKEKKYIPSIKPFLVYKWLEEFPENGKLFFLHDADIIFRELPDFNKLINDDIIYVSDTIGYIGYDYIMDCCNRYETNHPSSNKGQLIEEMSEVIGLSVDTIKENQNNSGGGQYIIKNTPWELWFKIYYDCVPLYNQMLDYHKRFPISPGEIQFWTAEMWSLLWNLWFFGFETKVVDELDFSWATDTIKIYEQRPILHMAGVTQDLKDKKFFKGDYINVNPLGKLKEDINFFEYIDENSATRKYIDVMKKIIKFQS
jgi:hypothetical protein